MGTQIFFARIQEVSAFRGIQEVSARSVRKELINHKSGFGSGSFFGIFSCSRRT